MLIEIVGREILDDTELDLDGKHSSIMGITVMRNKIYIPILSYHFYKKNELRFMDRLRDKIGNYFASKLVVSGFYRTSVVKIVSEERYGILIELWTDYSRICQSYLIYINNARAN